jgi:hypothetical protein
MAKILCVLLTGYPEYLTLLSSSMTETWPDKSLTRAYSAETGHLEADPKHIGQARLISL